MGEGGSGWGVRGAGEGTLGPDGSVAPPAAAAAPARRSTTSEVYRRRGPLQRRIIQHFRRRVRRGTTAGVAQAGRTPDNEAELPVNRIRTRTSRAGAVALAREAASTPGPRRRCRAELGLRGCPATRPFGAREHQRR